MSRRLSLFPAICLALLSLLPGSARAKTELVAPPGPAFETLRRQIETVTRLADEVKSAKEAMKDCGDPAERAELLLGAIRLQQTRYNATAMLLSSAEKLCWKAGLGSEKRQRAFVGAIRTAGLASGLDLASRGEVAEMVKAPGAAERIRRGGLAMRSLADANEMADLAAHDLLGLLARP